MQITNVTGVPLPLAVWVAHDEYDYIDTPNYISATSLMRPLKQAILANRIPPAQRSTDTQELVASALGRAIHDSIEKAWAVGSDKALFKLGYPADIINRIRVNPRDADVLSNPSIIPVYLEQRAFRTIVVNGIEYVIGGKFDMVADGIVQDTKSTSAFVWTKDTKDVDYCRQLSIYRWIDAAQPLPKIKEEFGLVNFVFTDFSKALVKSVPGYPTSRVQQKPIQLMSLEDTEAYIISKLSDLQRYTPVPEDQMPPCSDEDLWRDAPTYKYFADPSKTDGRSTKNFTDPVSARQFATEKGKGVVIVKPGEPKACNYCRAAPNCEQRKEYFRD